MAYWIFIYVFILTGCSNNHGAEEKIAVEDGKEGQVEEKIEGAVIESGNDIIKAGTEGKIYFCVHLGRTDGMNVSSSRAKKIAIQIVSDYYGQ